MAQQFHIARSYLARLSQGEMAVPAAMLAVLATEIDETLDDLRMASSEVSLNKLSLGGVENLSLGLKLLMQTAVLATQPGSPTHSLQVGPADAAAFKEMFLYGRGLEAAPKAAAGAKAATRPLNPLDAHISTTLGAPPVPLATICPDSSCTDSDEPAPTCKPPYYPLLKYNKNRQPGRRAGPMKGNGA